MMSSLNPETPQDIWLSASYQAHRLVASKPPLSPSCSWSSWPAWHAGSSARLCQQSLQPQCSQQQDQQATGTLFGNEVMRQTTVQRGARSAPAHRTPALHSDACKLACLPRHGTQPEPQQSRCQAPRAEGTSAPASAQPAPPQAERAQPKAEPPQPAAQPASGQPPSTSAPAEERDSWFQLNADILAQSGAVDAETLEPFVHVLGRTQTRVLKDHKLAGWQALLRACCTQRSAATEGACTAALADAQHWGKCFVPEFWDQLRDGGLPGMYPSQAVRIALVIYLHRSSPPIQYCSVTRSCCSACNSMYSLRHDAVCLVETRQRALHQFSGAQRCTQCTPHSAAHSKHQQSDAALQVSLILAYADAKERGALTEPDPQLCGALAKSIAVHVDQMEQFQISLSSWAFSQLHIRGNEAAKTLQTYVIRGAYGPRYTDNQPSIF